MFEIKHKNAIIQFEKISEHTPSHGDTVFFGFIKAPKFSTYAYLAQSQIDQIKKEHTNLFTYHPSLIIENKKSSWKTLKNAKNTNFFFNIGLITPIIKNQSHVVSTFKKTPFLELFFDDKRELFHELKNNISYKNITEFRTSTFNFDLKNNKKNTLNSVSYNIKDINNLTDLSIFLFGFSSKETIKQAINFCVLERNKEDYDLHIQKIRYLWFIRTLMTNQQAFKYIIEYEQSYVKTELYQNFLWLYNHEPNLKGISLLLSQINDIAPKYKILKNIDLPDHVLKHFTSAMETAFPVMNPRTDNIESLTYFYNSLSRDYGRLHLENFKNKPLSVYKIVKAFIDENKNFENYQFAIPKDYHEMVMMGSQFQNCAGNFDQIKHYSEVLPICIFKDNKPILYMSITNKGILSDLEDNKFKIGDLKGYKNGLPKKEDVIQIKRYLNQIPNIEIDFDNVEIKNK